MITKLIGSLTFSLLLLSTTLNLNLVAQTPSDLLNRWNTNVEDGTSYPQCEQWKITYPTGDEEKQLCETIPSNRREFFFVNDAGDGIVFRAPIRDDNGTTPNSSNVRSELREREIDGSRDAFWVTEGHHVIYVEQAITHLPTVKDELVATQIHGNKDEGIDDSMVLRLEGQHLFLSFNGGVLRSDVTVTTNYSLGRRHEVIFEVIDDKHYCYYSEDGNLKSSYAAGNAGRYLVTDNGNPVLMDISYGDAYFRAGNYTQSNPDQEGRQTNNANNYGEVVIYDLYVDHDGSGVNPTFEGGETEDGGSNDDSFNPDPNKKYYIDVPQHDLRIGATGFSEDPFTTSTDATGSEVEWEFVDKGNGSWHIQLAAGGDTPRLRSRNNGEADMQATSSSGTFTYYDFTPGARSNTFFATLPDHNSDHNRLQVDRDGDIHFVPETFDGGWESLSFTEVSEGSDEDGGSDGNEGSDLTLFEAEIADFRNGDIKEDSDASDDYYVDGSSGFNITFNVQADAGKTELQFRVKAPSGTRSMGVYVNGSAVPRITTSSRNWTTKITNATLRSGNNTIELRDSEGTAELDVDYLEVEGAGPGSAIFPDPNKSYYIDSAFFNTRLSASGSSETPFTQATSNQGVDTQWQFVDKGNGYWHIQLANNFGNLIRLRSDNSSSADMQATSSSGRYTYYEIKPSTAIDGSYFLTLPDGPIIGNRLQVNRDGDVNMVPDMFNGTWESFRITETGFGLLPN